MLLVGMLEEVFLRGEPAPLRSPPDAGAREGWRTLVNAGATWLDQQFVRDGNLATSRRPQDLIPFVQGCLDLFAEHTPISRTRQQSVSASAPPANEPPDVVL